MDSSPESIPDPESQDTDFNCQLSRNEFLRGICLLEEYGALQRPPMTPIPNVEQLFALADINKDGNLDFNEWLLLLFLMAPSLLSLVQQHAASPWDSRLLDALRRARHAWNTGSGFSMAHDQQVHEKVALPASGTRQALLPAYAEDPQVALLIRRSVELDMGAGKPRQHYRFTP